MKHSRSKIIVGIFVAFTYIALGVFGLGMISAHVAHGGMPMNDCPYAVGQHSICPMDAVSHLEAWQNMVRTIISFTLFIIVPVIVTYVGYFVVRISSPPILNRRPNTQPSMYVELFSSGILNPKVF
jgi:hypothetical protein